MYAHLLQPNHNLHILLAWDHVSVCVVDMKKHLVVFVHIFHRREHISFHEQLFGEHAEQTG